MQKHPTRSAPETLVPVSRVIGSGVSAGLWAVLVIMERLGFGPGSEGS